MTIMLTRMRLPRPRQRAPQPRRSELLRPPTFLLAQGADRRVIMETLGHSQIGATANVYSHVLDSLRQDVADKMDAILGTAVS